MEDEWKFLKSSYSPSHNQNPQYLFLASTLSWLIKKTKKSLISEHIAWAKNLLQTNDNVNGRKYTHVKVKYLEFFAQLLEQHKWLRMLAGLSIGGYLQSQIASIVKGCVSVWRRLEFRQPSNFDDFVTVLEEQAMETTIVVQRLKLSWRDMKCVVNNIAEAQQNIPKDLLDVLKGMRKSKSKFETSWSNTIAE